MIERKKEIEIQASVEKIFSVLLQFANLNVNKVDRISYKDTYTWLEISDKEIVRRIEMKPDASLHSIHLFVYNSNTVSHWDEKIHLQIVERIPDVCKLIICCSPNETFSSKIGFHVRRYSIDVWMEKVLEIIKKEVCSM